MKTIDLDKTLEINKIQKEGRKQIPDHLRQRLEELYTKIESGGLDTSSSVEYKRRNKAARPWKKFSVLAASTVVLSTCVLGTAFVSPAMANSLKQIPGVGHVFNLIGDLGLRTADENGILQASQAEAIQDNVKLKIAAVVFDGTRLSLALEREGHNEANDSLVAQLTKTELFVDGEPMNIPSGSLGGPQGTKNAAIMNFTDVHDLPDQFELTVRLELQGSKEPFQLVTPVVKTINQNVTIKPGVQTENEILRFGVDKVEITPSTVAIETTYTQLVDKLPNNYVDAASSAPTFDYDVMDSNGHYLDFISGKGETMTANHPKKLRTLFAPFAGVPETIIIKPYVFEASLSGELKKVYLPDLELKVPVSQEINKAE